MQYNALDTTYADTVLADLERVTESDTDTEVEEQVQTPWRLSCMMMTSILLMK